MPGKLRGLGCPACEGYDLAYMREHGFAKLKVGTKDDRAPHKNGNFPTPTGKCMFYVEGAKTLWQGHSVKCTMPSSQVKI
jgi:hypothetical protein